jgi:arginase family enzyme
VSDIITGVRGLNILGADIMEICPPRDSQEISAILGAALAFEMLCVLSEAREAKTGLKRRTHWNG